MKKLYTALGAACLVLLFVIATPANGQAPGKPDILEVIQIEGVITQGTATMVAAAVEKVNETPKIKGVLLLVNSPGGGVSATQVVVQELSKIKVPVVGFCQYECASGGVYLLMAPSVKFIGVREDTIGGSVGVIMHMQRFNRLLDWAKIDSETYKSGHLKDAGNPTRPQEMAEKVYLQGIVDQLAQKFYGVVARARVGKTLAWEEIKSAKIFIGSDIVRVGLADAVISQDDAVKKLKEMSGSKNAFTRDELRKITKDATEAASMSMPAKRGSPQADGWDRAMSHLDTAMEIVAEVRAGESVKFEYRMPYRF